MPPIALQLYSVRHEFSADMPGTLAAVARMGYSAVEFAGPPQHSAAALKTELNELGLACCGWHVPFNLVQDDELTPPSPSTMRWATTSSSFPASPQNCARAATTG